MADSVLETFGIFFESDAREVTQGANQAERATDDLGQAVEDVDGATQGLGDSFVDLIGSAQGALVSLLGAGAFTAGIINAAQMTDEIGKFSEALGFNIEKVSAWSGAISSTGGNAEEFRDTIGTLNESIVDLALTGGGPAVDVFEKLGIAAKDSAGKVRTAFDVLPELAEAFEKLPKAESSGLGSILGLDQATILLLQRGKTAVEDLVDRQKQLGIVTKEDYEIAAKFNEQWNDVQQVFRSLFVTAGSTILPVFTDLLKYAEEAIFFLNDNQELVEGFFIGISGVITAVYLPAITRVAIATAVAVAPYVAIGSAIIGAAAAFALIYEDIQKFLQGHDSLVGKIFKDYPLIEGIVLSLIGAVSDALEKLFAVGEYIADVFENPKKEILELWDVIKEFFAYLESKIPSLSDIGKNLGFGGGAEVDINNKFVVGSSVPMTNLQKAAAAYHTIDRNPLNETTSNNITNSKREVNKTTSVQVGEVNVNTQATDAEGMAAGASNALSNELQSAVNDFDDGVDM